MNKHVKSSFHIVKQTIEHHKYDRQKKWGCVMDISISISTNNKFRKDSGYFSEL